ncbi:MAG: malto-oligosyltrehalose synthase [Actinobacteria bacterium]|nr:malto-oligosyltrehalose synthase [Actinomycetota bacterium]
MPHLPAPGKPVPVSTYRVQLRPPAADHPGFGFDDAAAAVPYLAQLGVTHLYCSPYLQAAPGSAHGYDVVDHSQLNSELGGPGAFDRMVAACTAAGLGIILDVVPNHMAISEPESQNAQWWSVLRDGQDSPYADWFDINWSTTLDAQHYRLCHWREAKEGLNYRRFFDVTTLSGVRVEVPQVFDESHRIVVQQVRDGVLDGLRIDHPDGLADPGGYLGRLAEQTRGAWVVVEKILEPGERLPDDWACAGTTGYDALNNVLGVFVDPAGEQPLTEHWQRVTGEAASYEEVVARTKRLVLSDVLAAEVNRLTDVAVRDAQVDRAPFREALVEVLASFGVYRAYLPPAGPADATAREHVQSAVEAAKQSKPERATEIDRVAELALADDPASREFVTRFQQTCGPVMAKGVEDTAFYRYLRFAALNEVGGDPGRFGISTEQFHQGCLEMQAQWPLSMTTLSTHDTKRSEDVRARLVLLSQCPTEWTEAVTQWSAMAEQHGRPGAGTEQLVWQTLLGAWPITADRAVAYVEKATREAKDRTSWVDPVPAYDEAVAAFVRSVLADEQICARVQAFADRLAPAWRTTALAQKLVQLTMPGVADTYQGTELFDLSLVDPDNRRPVDYDDRRRLLEALSPNPLVEDSGAAKLHVVATALRLRRQHPQWFLADATYEPLDAGAQALAFSRSGRVVTVVPIRALSEASVTVELPAGTWHDVLTGKPTEGTDVLADFPVALLVREDA